MINKLLVVGVLLLVCVASVSALSVDYYYSPNCGHCERIAPFMQKISSAYNQVNWNMVDVTKSHSDVRGTPTLNIETDDNRKITMVGSEEIPRYLQCELNEQSNLNCETYSASECRAGSWFNR